MPTGYTAAIADGIDFKTYAMNCARAFGACVMLRDEPGGGERIPEVFEPSDYHLKALEGLYRELDELRTISLVEADSRARKEWEQEVSREKQRLARSSELREKYEAMLQEVDRWIPPTKDHEGLKGFMKSQIQESMKFDCSREDIYREIRQLDGSAWLSQKLASVEVSIQYHKKNHQEEVERAKQRTAWVQALRQSLL